MLIKNFAKRFGIEFQLQHTHGNPQVKITKSVKAFEKSRGLLESFFLFICIPLMVPNPILEHHIHVSEAIKRNSANSMNTKSQHQRGVTEWSHFVKKKEVQEKTLHLRTQIDNLSSRSQQYRSALVKFKFTKMHFTILTAKLRSIMGAFCDMSIKPEFVKMFVIVPPQVHAYKKGRKAEVNRKIKLTFRCCCYVSIPVLFTFSALTLLQITCVFLISFKYFQEISSARKHHI